MDRRWSPRTPASLDVDLLVRGRRIPHNHTRDLALGGAFVETSHTRLRRGATVQLVFNLKCREWPKRHRVGARVVRVTRDGIGLAYTNHDTGTFRALQAVMRHVHRHVEQA